MLKRGLSGEPVRRLQQKLGVAVDGEFGPATETALKAWQTKNGLAADGVAGPDTFTAMGLYELVLLKQGTKGEAVKKLQQKLGITADGQFGAGTEKAVRDFQGKNGLAADGVAGPATLAKMQIYKEITPDVVKASQIAPATADMGAAARSIWDTIKGIFK
jgi:peptidoglycan hydrolase-like protein with peptidoglycan-binding domain